MEPAPILVKAAPTGALPDAQTLTFLFTDVEGSTPLWERHEATMWEVTARHDALLDAVITAHNGIRVRERGEGDSIFAVFVQPADAVAAALAMARAVLAEPWPAETPIRVRMGLHSGSAQVRAGDYYGPVVNRCARIRGLGHGGQVLLSSTTAALVYEALQEEASLRSLGAHILKGLSEPEEVFQLCHPALPSEFPPLLSPQAPKHNLPQALSRLIGREAEQGEVLALLAESRLVTLVGSGGVGKTRLALAVAIEVVDQYPDGVWLVELGSLAEPSLVPGAVAQALGVREEPGRSLTATVQDYLKDRRLLLLLDNCEHLVGACADLASTLLRTCPGLRILATSREGLEVAGEQRYRVPSLSVPDPRHLPPPEITGIYEAVRLFVARARERRADFALTTQNAQAVAQVCARLDGIPLAIELAAARVPAVGVEGIAARLDDCFRLLTGGARDALPRQRTLRAALDWSYDLLSAQEQLLLDRLSAFAGGWTLDAAEAVCAGDGVEGWEVLDLLGSLVHKSLAQAEERENGEVRYGLLETVRQYAAERLAASGQEEHVAGRHLDWCLRLAEEADPHLADVVQGTWLERLETEHDNLRAALGWATGLEWAEPGGPRADALALAGLLGPFWSWRGHLGEGRRWLDLALAGAGTEVPLPLRTRALNAAAALARFQGDLGLARDFADEALALADTAGDARGRVAALTTLGIVASIESAFAPAQDRFEEALAVSRPLGDEAMTARLLGNLGNVAGLRRDFPQAQRFHEESLALRRRLGDTAGIAAALHNLAWLASEQREYEHAISLYEEATGLHRALGNRQRVAHALNGLGVSLQHGRQDLDRAHACFEESLATFEDLGDRWNQAGALTNLGLLALERGQHREAGRWLAAALPLHHALGERRNTATTLADLAALAAALGQHERAARILGATEAAREAIGWSEAQAGEVRDERVLATVRAALGEEAFAAAWTAGRALPLDDAIALALEIAQEGQF